MTPGITALVLSAFPYSREFPGLAVLPIQGIIRDGKEHYAARMNAISAVQTEHFFFLDDDDNLPENYLEVLAKCIAEDKPIVYTDEAVLREGMAVPSVLSKGMYSQKAHLNNPLLIHHLALYQTRTAKAIANNRPIGNYYPEFILAWEAAKHGVSYVPEVGYIWNKKDESGLHLNSSIVRSVGHAVNWAAGAIPE